MASKQYWVYILSSLTHSTYVGVTGDLERRIWEHKNQACPGHTSKYNIDRLVWFSEFSDVHEAIAEEKRIKAWRRNKKLDLIEVHNPQWLDLAAGWYK